MDEYKKCEICGLNFHHQSGKFTTHLVKEHNILLKDYIIKYELKGQTPKCKCGYCNDNAPFYRGKFLDRIGSHQKYKWLKEQYIKKYGIPKCETCKNDVNWVRGLPNKYCSFKCLPNRWNQEKIKETIKSKYNVNNISQLDEIRKKISEEQIINYSLYKEDIVNKFMNTCMERFGVNFPSQSLIIQNKMKKTYLKKYGVTHPSKLIKNRNSSSLRMIKNNSLFDFRKYYNVKKYKETNLCYQSSYEYHFLEFCEKNNMIDKIENGNVYNFLSENTIHGFRTVTDFCIGDIEIEIKSDYVLEKQGGKIVIELKRSAVEEAGKKYLLILDKDYSEFEKMFDCLIFGLVQKNI